MGEKRKEREGKGREENEGTPTKNWSTPHVHNPEK